MEPVEGRRKRACTRHAGGGTLDAGGGTDRLSALPDCLIHAVMSFMKARQVVQTCVLSRRWRHLWRSSPCLNVDFSEFTAKVVGRGSDGGSSGSSSSGESTYSDYDDDDTSDDSDNGVPVAAIAIPYDDDGIIGSDHDHDSTDSDHDSSSSSGEESSSSSREDDNSDQEDDDDIAGHDHYAGSGSDGGSSSSSNSDDDSTDHEDDIAGLDYYTSSGSDGGSNSLSSSSSDSDLDIDSTDSDYDDSVRDKEWQGFEDFAVSLMLRCNMEQLDSFRLRVSKYRAPITGDAQAGGWLHRTMNYCAPYPPCQREGWSSSSWNLKRLYLYNVALDNRFVKNVSSVCRSLQHLELEKCNCEIHSITSDSLKNLVLKRCDWMELSEIASPTLQTLVIDGGGNTYTCRLVILAPAVACLHLAVHASDFHGGISIYEMPSLVNASIDLQCSRSSLSKSKFRGNQFKVLPNISNVTSLELSSVGTMMLSKEPTFQEFKNLRSLLLGNWDINDHILGLLVSRSPRLEKLTLRHCKFSNDSKEKEGTAKLNKSSSSDCHRLDFHFENLKLEIIYRKEEDYCQLAEVLPHFIGNLLKNIKCTKKVCHGHHSSLELMEHSF